MCPRRGGLVSTITATDAVAEELWRNGAVRDCEVHRKTKSGAERILVLSIDPVNIGEKQFLLTTAVDVTEKKQAQGTLQEREQRLRLALEASAAGSWTRDVGANDVNWDEGFRRLYGFAPDEPATVAAWLGRVHEDDRPQLLGLVNDVLHATRDAWDTTFRIMRIDGTLSWIQSVGRAERDTAGKVTRLTVLELDVTARRQVEEALQARRDEEHNRELPLLLETAAKGIPQSDAQRDCGPDLLLHTTTGPVAQVVAGGTSITPLKILVVDDYDAVRSKFREVLQERPELRVVGEAADGLEAIAQAHSLRPDVILMDVSMPHMDGVEATRHLRAELPFIQILGLSAQPRTQRPHAIEQVGAAGYFTKGFDTERLINHLLIIARGHAAKAGLE
jgi:PAS domain S-box-containing protein